MKTIQWFLVILAGSVMVESAAQAGEIPAPPQRHPVAVRGATIHTVSRGVIEGGTIVFDNGKIRALGQSVVLPESVEVIDGTGKHVYPGMIDAWSTLGLMEIDAVRATNDVSESGSLNPNARAEVAINPESELIPVTRVNGVALALTSMRGGIISGTAALIALDGWTWEEMTTKPNVALVAEWPRMTINRAWWEQRSEEDQKREREKALDELRNAFRDARSYWQAKKSGSPSLATDLRWEAMIPVLEGKEPVLMQAEESQQIQAAVAWARQENIKIVIVGGYDAWRVTDVLRENNVPVIVTPIYRTPWRRWEAYDDPYALPSKLHSAGVQFCIAGDGSASNERNLPYHAATAAAYGLPKEEALKSVTLYPAIILGVADRVGSLEVGKDATLIVTTGDPLEITTHVERLFIEGKNIPRTTKHTRLYEKYREKYRRLQAK